MIAARNIPGSGSAISAGAYTDEWTHGLGAATPAVNVYRMTAVSPAQWQLVPQTGYDLRFPTPDSLSLTLASTPPSPGHVGALKLVVDSQLAASASFDSTPPAAGISQAQFRDFLSAATNFVRTFLATTIRLADDPTDVPAARWSLTETAKSEAAGFLPQCDIAFRMRLDSLPEVTIQPEVTRVTEGSRVFRVDRILSANGDPAIVLECTAV